MCEWTSIKPKNFKPSMVNEKFINHMIDLALKLEQFQIDEIYSQSYLDRSYKENFNKKDYKDLPESQGGDYGYFKRVNGKYEISNWNKDYISRCIKSNFRFKYWSEHIFTISNNAELIGSNYRDENYAKRSARQNLAKLQKKHPEFNDFVVQLNYEY